MKTTTLVMVGAIALGVAGCAHRQVNQKLTRVNPAAGYYFSPQGRTNNSDDLLLALAFSGGGTRAAAFACGVLEELRDTTVPSTAGSRSLLNEVDVISSVSGGSVTAAAYGLYGRDMFGVLPGAFLKRNVQQTLLLKTLNPLNWPALWSPYYGRSDMAAEYYDRILFHGATFGDLRRQGGPHLIINATDISTGARFEFTQSCFDMICSDLETYPVSRAVAASSAVPGVLTPITLDNYGPGCGCEVPDWVSRTQGLEDGRVRLRAQEVLGYLTVTNRPYLHLMDGGVSGNLGLNPFIEYMESLEFSASQQQALAQAMPRRVVLISVNAYSSPDQGWDRKESPPNSLATVTAAACRPIERISKETLELIKSEFGRWQGRLAQRAGIRLYPIFLNFTNFQDPDERRRFLNMPTSFVLPATDIEDLQAAGHRLLRGNAVYQELLKDLGAGDPAGGAKSN